jgi:cytoskeletal protein RodZ
VVVGQLLVTAEYALDSALKLGLQQPVFKGVTWITPFFVIYFVLLVGLWFGLNKFGFFPRPEPLPSTRSSGGSSSSKKGVTQIPGIGGPRPRRADVTPPTANGKKSAATPAKATAKPSATSSTQASSSGAYDDAYERVKAAQRQKRRRELH